MLFNNKNIPEHVREIIENLNKNKMAGFYVDQQGPLISLLDELIKDGETVGCGDSMTLEQLGVFDHLRIRNIHFLDKFQPSLTGKDKRELYLQNFRADTFVTGVNAITKKGELFNIDGNGSRVAPMLYGPGQVIVVAGLNKITDNLDEAIKRTRQIAAPLDAKRLGKSTPCAALGRCIDCSHKERFCNDFVLITGQFIKDRIKVIIVDQSLGY
ncbi:lactate utilization protein [Lacrimispora sp.]|uniref:lactate utilization protein n=1 Tax=Lacrimispora sp. TaxID=2719234 RepID=UPI0032E4E168